MLLSTSIRLYALFSCFLIDVYAYLLQACVHCRLAGAARQTPLLDHRSSPSLQGKRRGEIASPSLMRVQNLKQLCLLSHQLCKSRKSMLTMAAQSLMLTLRTFRRRWELKAD